MKWIKSTTALLLCFLMMVPTQGMVSLADATREIEIVVEDQTEADEVRVIETESHVDLESEESEYIQETLPLEELEPEEKIEESEHMQETLPLEPIEKENISVNESLAIYWNPGGSLPPELTATDSNAEEKTDEELEEDQDEELATASNALKAADKAPTDPSNAPAGNDRANGLTAARPVKTLETALKQAERLADEQGVDKSDITIYAMSPMEIVDGRMYVLNAGNIKIASWSGRAYDNDTIFYLNGGQMTLMNTVLESGTGTEDVEEAELIRVYGGALQIGRDVVLGGRIVMDYRNSREEAEWDQATDSNAETPATASSWTEEGSRGGSFDIDEYILNTEPDAWEVLEEKSQASTWKEPIIELIDGFEGTEEGYLIDIRNDDSRDTVTLAKTLYADEVKEEDFTSFFRLADANSSEWDLISSAEEKATVRDTGADDLQQYYRSRGVDMARAVVGVDSMTKKTLAATRSTSTKRIYWNPGPRFEHSGSIYPAGDDINYDGTTPFAPLKSLDAALDKAKGATIIVMQTLDLGGSNTADFLPRVGGSWIVEGEMLSTPTLKIWEVTASPLFKVGRGQSLILKNIKLEGLNRDGTLAESPAILVEGGDLTIDEKVSVKTGYIQVRAGTIPTLVAHPIRAASTNEVSVSLSFPETLQNISYTFSDVIVPTTALLPAGATPAEKDAMGLELLKCYGLARVNRSVENGGSSRFDWVLRQDIGTAIMGANPQNLELYAEHYYDAIYLDGTRTGASGLGATCEDPVSTWAEAEFIWGREMGKSITKRTEAHGEGLTKEEIDLKYPYPDTIYICGTVTVPNSQIWELSLKQDYDGSMIETEVVSHNPDTKKGDADHVHESPNCLVKVEGNLTITNIKIRNNTDLPDSQTILVDGKNTVKWEPMLILAGTTTMIGARKETSTERAKEITRGTHVAVQARGWVRFGDDGWNTSKPWTGSIEGRQQGVTAKGVGTMVEMNEGTIQKNDTYDPTLPETVEAQKKGAGVAVSDQANLVMFGGTISENKTFAYGGGVYVEGEGSRFTLGGAGTVTKNTISKEGTKFDIVTKGIGVYGGTGTIVAIDVGGTVSENRGYIVEGGGVYSNGKLTITGAEISGNRADSSIGGQQTGELGVIPKGIGVFIDTDGELTMGSTNVINNKVMSDYTCEHEVGDDSDEQCEFYENGFGAGVYVGSKKVNEIRSSVLSGNTVGKSSDGTRSRGGAIYVRGVLTIDDSTISGNRAFYGGGIAIDETSGIVNINISDIKNNIASNSASASTNPKRSGTGGGIYSSRLTADSATRTAIEGSNITNNEARIGGGVQSVGGELHLKHYDRSSPTRLITLKGNIGGGVAITGGSLSALGIEILENTGNGLRVEGDAKVYFKEGKIARNKADKGAGVITDGKPTLYFGDVEVFDNIATGDGGGLYLDGEIHWSESAAGRSFIRGNSANRGGGIFFGNEARGVLDFASDIKNTATTQGSNFYVTASQISMLQGACKQPDPADQKAGVYNVFVATNPIVGRTNKGLSLDPQVLEIEKKAVGAPDAICLDNGTSFLRYYRAAPAGRANRMPIDVLNKNAQAGSVIIAAANQSEVITYSPNATVSAAPPVTRTFPALTDASVNSNYTDGGNISSRMWISKGTVFGHTGMILLGEGVYLGGAGANDSNTGLTPDSPVATFAEADRKLRALIGNNKATGYAPFIYICGLIEVTASQTWKMDHTDSVFDTDNAAYLAARKSEPANAGVPDDRFYPQIRRFAAFTNLAMIQVSGSGATLTLENIIIDGMAETVNVLDQGERSPVVAINSQDAALNMSGAQIRNNYANGVLGIGKVTMFEGSSLVDIEGKAIQLEDGGELLMQETVKILSIDSRMPEAVPKPSRYGVCYTNGSDTEGLITMSRPGSSPGGAEIRGSTDMIGGTDKPYANFVAGIEVEGKVLIHMDSGSTNIIAGQNGVGVSLKGKGAKLWMTKVTDRTNFGKPSVVGGAGAISISGEDCEVFMGQNSVVGVHSVIAPNITQSQYGINIQSGASGTTKIHARGTATISTARGGSGIYIDPLNKSAVEILLEGDAKIVENVIGIQDDAGVRGLNKLAITMRDRATISGSNGAGIQLTGSGWEAGSSQTISLFGRTEIKNNGGSGIETQGPTEIKLKENGSITDNQAHGIQVQPERGGTTEGGTVMIDGWISFITGNGRSGIYNDPKLNQPNQMKIVVEDQGAVYGNLVKPTIDDAEIVLNSNSELHLYGDARVTSSDKTILAYGKIHMEGSVQVDGKIYLQNHTKPITLKTVPTAGREFNLHLAEGFVGKDVVIPEAGAGISASDYMVNYVKDGGDGAAKDESLIKSGVNIALTGGGNVYLSGSGDDGNEGNSPATAVRTFKQAKHLLATKAHMKGGNILICESEVLIDQSSTDTDWSFDRNGEVTNLVGGSTTWKPLVQRYKEYKGRMISVTDRSVSFGTITIDGNKDQVGDSSGEVLYLTEGGTATLGSGSVFQNNQVSIGTEPNRTAGIWVHSGNLKMEGGIIQGMTLQSETQTDQTQPIASAILSGRKDAKKPSTVVFSSGKIQNNTIEEAVPFSYMNGAAVAIGSDTTFTMSGGTISENSTISSLAVGDIDHKQVRGGGLYVVNGLVNISGGIISDNNGNIGSAIYYHETGTSEKTRGLILSGGEIAGNNKASTVLDGENSPVYIEGVNFQLQGGGCDVKDAIYLSGDKYRIIVSGDIYQSGRQYKICLNQGAASGQYGKGSVVVLPDGDKRSDVSSYLTYFTLRANPYVMDIGQSADLVSGELGVRENQSLLLMKAVFVDGETGDDKESGVAPSTAVKTFQKAQEIGQAGTGKKDYYILYVCGSVIAEAATPEPVWTMESPAYLCRYTGFDLYPDTGNFEKESNPSYYGPLVSVEGNLTLNGFAIYGRRSTDASSPHIGDSLIQIKDGATVIVKDLSTRTSLFGRNHNGGEYINQNTGSLVSLPSQGGAFYVASGGILRMESGQIVETYAVNGEAIYLATDETAPNKTGRLQLTNSPSISGLVYLSGRETVVEAEGLYAPLTPIRIAIQEGYGGRVCIRYPNAASATMTHYSFEESIKALYGITIKGSDIVLEQNRAFYLDGKGGNDGNNGTTPAQAVKTLKRIYALIGSSNKSNAIVYVVGTVTVADKIKIENVRTIDLVTGAEAYNGRYEEADTLIHGTSCQISFKRYSGPTSAIAGYEKPSLLGELFVVKSTGELDLGGMYLDGHSQPSIGLPALTAAGVIAEAPLITVETGGKLTCYIAGSQSGIPCRLQNNTNSKPKASEPANLVGTMPSGTVIYQGSSAGIELLGGEARLINTEFQNLELGKTVVGGTDVYHNGSRLSIEREILFGDSIFLEGLGVAATSKHLEITAIGTPVRKDFQVLMRDPYIGRKVVVFNAKGEVSSDQIGVYRLEEKVKNFFALISTQDPDKTTLTLEVPAAVYVDGVNGNDTQRDAGVFPNSPLKTLEAAYNQLKTRAGDTIYVVDTITIDRDIFLSGNRYEDRGSGTTIIIPSTDKVNITRYIQPDFARTTPPSPDAGRYQIGDFTGVLLEVEDGKIVDLGNGVRLDGHSETKTYQDCPEGMEVTRTTTSQAPLLSVSKGATVNLQGGSVLKNNKNISTTLEGGGIYNLGTVIVTGAEFENNEATKGTAAYQAGTFTIESIVGEPEDLDFYLTSENKGTVGTPNWEDHMLKIAGRIPNDQIFKINMLLERSVKGRDVIEFTDAGAYLPPGADEEHEHFHLSTTVPTELFLVEADPDSTILELQDWQILTVEVPANIYLAFTQGGSTTTVELKTIQSGSGIPSVPADLFSTSEYEITNKSNYSVQIFVNGVDDIGAAEGIAKVLNLKETKAETIGKDDLYLAITTNGPVDVGGFGFGISEIPLRRSTPTSLGKLRPTEVGTFGFVGQVGTGFISEHKDTDFPISGKTNDEVQAYMKNKDVAGVTNARAKYRLKYKVQIDPTRR